MSKRNATLQEYDGNVVSSSITGAASRKRPPIDLSSPSHSPVSKRARTHNMSTVDVPCSIAAQSFSHSSPATSLSISHAADIDHRLQSPLCDEPTPVEVSPHSLGVTRSAKNRSHTPFQPVNITTLPFPVLVIIFSYAHTDFIENLRHRRVCRSFRDALRNSEIITNLAKNSLWPRQLAKLVKFNPAMLNEKSTISKKMFGILTGWLMEVCDDFHLSQRTLSLSLLYIMLYLHSNFIEKKMFQALGQVCLWIASKHEDVYEVPRIDELITISDYSYQAKQLIDLEMHVLKTLNFSLHFPTTLDFIELYLLINQSPSLASNLLPDINELYALPSCFGTKMNANLHSCAEAHGLIGNERSPLQRSRLCLLAFYLFELSAHDFDFVCELPSYQAASIVYFARSLLRLKPWTIGLMNISLCDDKNRILFGVNRLKQLYAVASNHSVLNIVFQRHCNRCASGDCFRYIDIPETTVSFVTEKFSTNERPP